MEFSIGDTEHYAPGDELSRRVNRYERREGGPRLGKTFTLEWIVIRQATGNTWDCCETHGLVCGGNFHCNGPSIH